MSLELLRVEAYVGEPQNCLNLNHALQALVCRERASSPS
jgi:hypothetical protein